MAIDAEALRQQQLRRKPSLAAEFAGGDPVPDTIGDLAPESDTAAPVDHSLHLLHNRSACHPPVMDISYEGPIICINV